MVISYRLYSIQKHDFPLGKSRWEFLGMLCAVSIVKCTFFESVEMILEFLREKTLVVDDDDNSVKNAIDIPKGQIQFIFWSNSSSTLHQTSLLRGELVGWGINGGYDGTNTILSAKKTSHVEQPPPGAFVCIRDDDDDVLKHFSSFFFSFLFLKPLFSHGPNASG